MAANTPTNAHTTCLSFRTESAFISLLLVGGSIDFPAFGNPAVRLPEFRLSQKGPQSFWKATPPHHKFFQRKRRWELCATGGIRVHRDRLVVLASRSTRLPRLFYQLSYHVFAINTFGSQPCSLADHCDECRLPTGVDARRPAEIDHNA